MLNLQFIKQINFYHHSINYVTVRCKIYIRCVCLVENLDFPPKISFPNLIQDMYIIFLFLHVLKSLLKGFCWNCYLPKRKIFHQKHLSECEKNTFLLQRIKTEYTSHMRGFNNISSHSKQSLNLKQEKVVILANDLVQIDLNLICMDIVLCIPQQF